MNQVRKTPLHSPRVVKKIRKRRMIILGILFVLFCLFCVFLYFATRLSGVSIKAVQVFGAETLKEEEISAFADKKLFGSYFFIINKRNIFTYPKNQIEQALLVEFPRIKEVKVSEEAKTLKVELVERDPAGVWCSKEPKCFFFDMEGFLYGDSPEFSGSVYSVYRGGENEFGDLGVGKKFLDTERLGILDEFKKILEGSSLYISEIIVTDLREVNLTSVKSPKIIIDLTGNLEEQKMALVSILEDEALKDKFDLKNTSYVDLRFGKKVFFKEKVGVQEEAKEEESQ